MGPEAHRTPVYEQIAESIREQIKDGRLKDGDALPSLSALAEAWGVVSETAKRAVDRLRGEGLVAVRQGARTVVTTPRIVAAEPLVASGLHVLEGAEVRMQITDDSVVFTRIND